MEKPRLASIALPAGGLLALTIAVHFIFSPLGFNPTDDGFTLAYSRRLLEGEVPHRDFIIIRPALSPLLHVPEVWLGGEHTYWISRLVFWLQLAVISFVWTLLITEALGLRQTPLRLFGLSVLAFAASQNFATLVWHTVDGLFLVTLGVFLCTRQSPRRLDVPGYLLIGAAYLTKQSFLFLGPAALVLLGHYRRPSAWLAWLAPGVLYVAFLIVAGGLDDAFEQLTSQRDLFEAGIRQYLQVLVLAGFLAGLVAGFATYSERKLPFFSGSLDWQRLAGIALLAAFIGGTGLAMAGDRYASQEVYALFGAAGGLAAYRLVAARHRIQEASFRYEAAISLLVLISAWSVSISVGDRTPALAGGALLALIATQALRAGDSLSFAWRPLGAVAAPAMIVIAAVAVGVGWVRENAHYVYRDRPASELSYSLGGVFPGGGLIKTNASTYAFLEDLEQAIEKSGPGRYAIVPDLPGYWAKARQRNPLPVDWPQSIELKSAALVERVVDSLESQRGDTTVIAQKISAEFLAEGFVELTNGPRFGAEHYSGLLAHVRNTWQKVGETRFFELYR